VNKAPHAKQMGKLYVLRHPGEIPLTAKSVGISLAFMAVVRSAYTRTLIALWNRPPAHSRFVTA
jgi:hypothetical protein